MSFTNTKGFFDRKHPGDFWDTPSSRYKAGSFFEQKNHTSRIIPIVLIVPQKSSRGTRRNSTGGVQPKDMRSKIQQHVDSRMRNSTDSLYDGSNQFDHYSIRLNLFSNVQVYDHMGTIFGLGSSVHAGTELALNSSKAAIVLTKYMGPESVIALKSTASYVGKIARVTSRGASFLSVGYSFYEIDANKAKAHTWVNLSVTAIVAGAEFFIGAAAAPYIIIGGVAYGIFSIAGGNEWLDNLKFMR